MTVDIVIASYKEPLDWFDIIPKSWRIFLYNVDDKRTSFPIPPTARIPNGGREAGPWLYHLETQWGNYADVTLFVQGRPFDHEGPFLRDVIVNEKFPHPICYIAGIPPKTGALHIPCHGLPEECLRKGWGDTKIPPPIWFSCGAQFYVKREVIMQRPASHYAAIRENCYDPKIHSFGHTMEPMWGCVFDWEPFC